MRRRRMSINPLPTYCRYALCKSRQIFFNSFIYNDIQIAEVGLIFNSRKLIQNFALTNFMKNDKELYYFSGSVEKAVAFST